MPGATDTAEVGGTERRLTAEEKRRLGLLALPTLGLALAITMVTTYLGEVARRYTHNTLLIGAIIGGEGIMGLWIPLSAGTWSDRLRTPLGGRLPFVLAGAVPTAAALCLIGLVHSLGLVALVALFFFAFYFVAYEPYRAMYPDLVDEEEVAGRAQSTQALARGLGTGMALLGGGLLLSVARELPFVVAAFVVLATVGSFAALMVHRGLPEQGTPSGTGPLEVVRQVPRLLRRNEALRAYLIANALWEVALSALKAFVVLYLTIGLGYALSSASLIIGGVAMVILGGAAVAGKAGDRFGGIPTVRVALWAYGLGFLVPLFTTSRIALALATPLIAFGGGAVMTMSYAILMPLMPADEHGALTGFYSLSRAVGNVAGPLLAGAVILLGGQVVFSGTHGFQAVWIVCSAAALVSLVFLRRLQDAAGEGER